MIAVLFARADSIYKTMPECDVWDAERDARNWPGGCPVVAHPPCRAWGRLAHFAKPRHDEKDLARWAVAQIRRYGGVLEHPASSKLWKDQNLPEPGQKDEFGGWTLPVLQWWWGHRAAKATRFYIVGSSTTPDIPIRLGEPTHVIGSVTRKNSSRGKWKPQVTHAEREHTPPDLARWLVDLAKMCGKIE